MNGVTCGWQTDPKIPRSAFWALIGAMIGGVGTFGSVLAFLTATGACGVDSDSDAFRACSALAALLGGPGGALGYVLGYCLARLSRLQPNRGRRCISGLVLRIARMQFSGGVALAAFTYDPDWTFDLAPRSDEAADLVSRDALWIRCYTLNLDCKDRPHDPNGTPTIHCEIPSRIGEWGCIGGSIGAVAGAALGAAVVIALAPLALGCGPLAFLCLLLILLLGGLITYLGAELGAIIGHRIGEALDAGQGLASAYGEGLCGSCLSVEGDWVTDQDHGHNEIHDVEGIPLLVHPPPGELFRVPDACPDGCPGVIF